MASKITRSKTTDKVDNEIDALLAQAEAIKDNPDAYLPAEEVVEMAV